MLNRYLPLIFIPVTIVSLSLALYYYTQLQALKNSVFVQRQTLQLAQEISVEAKNIRIATYPTPCDALTKKVIGEECDLGNYMEWAGPNLEEKTTMLVSMIKENR